VIRDVVRRRYGERLDEEGLVMPTKDTGGGQEKAARKTEEVDEVAVEETGDVQDRVGKLTDEVDDLLDEIDDVLEANAEEFVRGYVQKGGE
jgi:ubiquitin-like protein Pup